MLTHSEVSMEGDETMTDSRIKEVTEAEIIKAGRAIESHVIAFAVQARLGHWEECLELIADMTDVIENLREIAAHKLDKATRESA